MVSLQSASSSLGVERAEAPTRRKSVTKMDRATAALHNREMALHLISTMGALTQLQIAGLTQLQPSTVSYIVRELKSRGLVREGRTIPTERAGPKETLIEMNPAALWSAGLTLDAMGNKLCLMNAAGHIICQRTFSPEANVTVFLELIPSHLGELTSQYHLELDEATVTTVSVPGVVNTTTGCVLNSMSLHLENYPLGEILSKTLQHPVVIERNTVCGAYAERHMGCARSCDHFLYFLARPQMNASGGREYSFGLTMVMNGGIYHGYNSAAGELHSGILQSVLSEQASLPSGPFLEQKDIASALRPLGRELGKLVDLLDPEMLVVCSDEQLLTNDNLQILRQTTLDSLINVPGRKFELARSLLGIDGTLYGAALMGLHRGMKRRLAIPRARAQTQAANS